MKIDFRMIRARRAFTGVREQAYETIGNSMIKDGVPLRECLSKLAERARQDGDPVAPLYQAWLRRMGDTRMKGEFALCVKPDIPNSDYMVMKGFEQSGKLAEGILYQSKMIGRMRKMKSEFIGTMVKPVISFLAIAGVSAFFATAAKGFLDVAPMEKWPLISRVMFKFTLFMDANIHFVLGGFVVAMTWLIWSMGNWGARNVWLRHKLDNFLPYVIYRDFSSFSTMIVLSALMSSGMPLKLAAQSIFDSGNPWIKSYFRKIVRRLGDSSMKSPAQAFDVGFFPQKIYYRVLDSSERGGFDDAIKRIAEDSFESMEAAMKKRTFVLDQIVMAITGGTAALIAGGLTSAIGVITTLIKSGG